QAVEVERAQEPPLGVGDRGGAQVDDRRRRGLVVGDAGQEEDQPRRLLGGRVVPAAAGVEGDPLLELAVTDGVPAGQQAPFGVQPVRLVAERRRGCQRGYRRGGHPRVSSGESSPGWLPGAGRWSVCVRRATSANLPHGRAVRSLKNRPGPFPSGPGPVGTAATWIWPSGTPA